MCIEPRADWLAEIADMKGNIIRCKKRSLRPDAGLCGSNEEGIVGRSLMRV